MNNISINQQAATVTMTPSQRALARIVTLPSALPATDQGAEDLAGDTFHTLHGASAIKENAPTSREINKQLIQWMKESPGFAEAEQASRSNLPAAMATSSLLWAIISSDQAMAEMLEAQRKIEEAQQAAQDAKNKAMADPSDKNQAKADQLAQAAKNLQQEASDKLEAMKNNIASQSAMRTAVKQATDKAKETAETMRGWGMDSGDPTQIDPAQALEYLAKMDNAKLKAIAKLAGRLAGISMSTRSSTPKAGHIPVDITYTRNLSDIFTSELMLLAPAMPLEVQMRQANQYNQHGLLGWIKSQPQKEAGSFVAAVDCSGSAAGQIEIVEKAIALGIAQVAKKENRPYHLISFSGGSDPLYFVDSKQEWQNHLEWAGLFQGGGTSFNKIIMHVLNNPLINKSETDMLLITDGLADISTETLAAVKKAQKEQGFRLIFITVDCLPLANMQACANKIITLDDIENNADSVTRQIVSWMK